ncbi:MAG: hypothetical protein IKS33_01990 [Bacteroidales bacterium]|nr:hypothetical protein [Bacteroidales bacterium]
MLLIGLLSVVFVGLVVLGSLRIRSAKQKIILPLFPFMLIHSTNRLCNIQSNIYL